MSEDLNRSLCTRGFAAAANAKEENRIYLLALIDAANYITPSLPRFDLDSAKFEKLSATERSLVKAIDRFMEFMSVNGEAGEQLRQQQTHLLDGLATIIGSRSVELIRDIGVSFLECLYQVAKDRGSDSLRKAVARMLGSLMLKSDFNPEDIEFLKDDLQSVFSSTAYPRLLNEDDFFYKMDAAYMFLGQGENGLPPDDKKKLLSLLDLPLLSYSATRKVERFLKNKWGRPLLSELRMRKFVRPTREYKRESLAVVVTEADLRDDVARLAITDRFEREPDTMCILDVPGFLDESGKLLAGKLKNLPPNVRHLSFVNGSRCTAIGDDFLKKHPSLTTADFSCLPRVTKIGRKFLSRCKSLTSVHLPEELQIFGYGFLNCCDSLGMMDLSKYKTDYVVVTEAVLRNFADCSAITDRFEREPNTMCILDVPSFVDESGKLLTGKLKGLPSQVRHLYFSNGSCCTAIGDDFLEQHPSLRTADLTNLKNVTEIGNSFLGGCTSLTTVDLASLNNVTKLDNSFLWGCSSLTTVDLAGLNNVTEIGNTFLWRCTSLTTVDLAGLNNVTKIGNSFLSRCSSLTTVNLASLNNIAEIGNNFLWGCSSLTTVDLAGLNNVTEIDNRFLSRCSSLTTADLSGLNNVTKIRSGFLHRCSSLSVDVGTLKPESVVRKEVMRLAASTKIKLLS